MFRIVIVIVLHHRHNPEGSINCNMLSHFVDLPFSITFPAYMQHRLLFTPIYVIQLMLFEVYVVHIFGT
jgi:hypothetical protein